MTDIATGLFDAGSAQSRLAALNVYKRGVLNGYAADGPSRYELRPNGQRVFSFLSGRWEFRDSYFVGDGGFGFGMTTLLYDGLPAWFMQYAGRYDKSAIPCLKAALRAGAAGDDLVGGRGPRLYIHSDRYKYVNKLQDAGFFAGGTGRECIYDDANVEVGHDIVTWGVVN